MIKTITNIYNIFVCLRFFKYKCRRNTSSRRSSSSSRSTIIAAISCCASCCNIVNISWYHLVPYNPYLIVGCKNCTSIVSLLYKMLSVQSYHLVTTRRISSVYHSVPQVGLEVKMSVARLNSAPASIAALTRFCAGSCCAW